MLGGGRVVVPEGVDVVDGAGGSEEEELEGSKTDSTEGTVTPTVLQAYAAYAYAFEASVLSQELAIQWTATLI